MKTFIVDVKLTPWDGGVITMLVSLIKEAGYQLVQYENVTCNPDDLSELVCDQYEKQREQYDKWLEEEHNTYVNRVTESGLPLWIADMYGSGSFYTENQDLDKDVLPF